MYYVIQSPSGEYLAPGEYKDYVHAEYGVFRTWGRQWTKAIENAQMFGTWQLAEVAAGDIFSPGSNYMETIKEIYGGK